MSTETLDLFTTSWADFSPCGLYRYSLGRVWDPRSPRGLFVMLNPSTADATKTDATLARCVRRLRDLEFGSLEVVNLFAYRSTQPAALRGCADPVGPGNNDAIEKALRAAAMIVVAWGNDGRYRERDAEVLRLVAHRNPYCLGTTSTGAPRHPLHLGYNQELIPYRGQKDAR